MRHNTPNFRNFFLSSIKMASYIIFSRGDQRFFFFLTHAPVLPETVIEATEEIEEQLSRSVVNDAKQSLPERLKAAIRALDNLTPEEKEVVIVNAEEKSARYALLWTRLAYYLPLIENLIAGETFTDRVNDFYDKDKDKGVAESQLFDAIHAQNPNHSYEEKDSLYENAFDTVKHILTQRSNFIAKDKIFENTRFIDAPTFEKELEKMQSQQTTYWVHGHTDSKGDSKHSINLDNRLGKFPYQNARMAVREALNDAADTKIQETQETQEYKTRKTRLLDNIQSLEEDFPGLVEGQAYVTLRNRLDENKLSIKEIKGLNFEITKLITKLKGVKSSYSTLVIHNGDEHEAKTLSHTEYKNIWADLEQHPSAENKLTENKEIDPVQLGVQAMAAGDTLVLGDMHANALRLVYHLIKHGIFVDVSEETYEAIRNCYHEIDRIYTQSNRNITWEIGQQLEAQYEIFYSLIDSLQIREIAIHLHLLGDLLSDRGVSDELIRTVLSKLKNKNITLSIQASNHGQYYLKNNPKDWNEQQKSSKNDAAYKFYLNNKYELFKEYKAKQLSLYYISTAGLTGALSITTLILQATGHWAALPSSLAPVLSIGTTTLLGVSGLLLSSYLGYKANKAVGWVAALGTLGFMAMPVLNHMGIVPALAGPLAGSIIKLSIIAAASLAFSMVACSQKYQSAAKSLSNNAEKLYVATATITAVLSITLLVVSSLDQKLLPMFITQALPILSPLATGALGLSGLLLSGYLGKKHGKEVGAAGCAGVMALVAVPLLHHAGVIHWFQTSELSAITLGIIALSAAALFAEKKVETQSNQNG